jgi:hypothetical protein
VPIGPDGYYGSSDWQAMSLRRRAGADCVVDVERTGAVLAERSVAASRDAASVFADTASVPREAEAGEQ